MPRHADRAVVDLLGCGGGSSGPVWGTETEDLNATLLAWGPGEGSPEHVNTERDVLLVVVAGSATVTLGEERHLVRAGSALVLEKGLPRSISAGAEGVRYLSVHRRRAPLQIARRPA
jgi:quercetin dioxygenase-like cupin family protein